MTWLITGGAGYIGSHVVQALRATGRNVVVVDDLSSGRPGRLPDDVRLVRASVLDTDRLARVLRHENVRGVVHLAAKKAVDESMTEPLYYYRENVAGFQSLLEAVTAAGVPRVVLSSSAAVYGPTGTGRVTEDSATAPVNPYGASKLMCERILRDVAAATGLGWLALRYFNVAGAVEPGLADHGASNLIPKAFAALDAGVAPVVYGDDYPTPDGTCVRDFVHVQDVAEAHVAAVERLEAAPRTAAVYNVGRGTGSSVAQVLSAVARISGRGTPPRVVGRRPGDPASVVASAAAIRRDLGWTARRDLPEMVESAWHAWQAGTDGRRALIPA